MPSLDRPNHEEPRDSPCLRKTEQPSTKSLLLSTFVDLKHLRGGTWKAGTSARDSQSRCCVSVIWNVLLVLVLAALCVSQALLWARQDSGCSNYHHDHPSAPSASPFAKTDKEFLNLKSLNRLRRTAAADAADLPPLYITLDQYIDEKAALLDSIDQASSHPVAQYVLNQAYTRKHVIETQKSLKWVEAVGSLFNLTSDGRELQVVTSGYYHIDLTAMFNGREQIRGYPPCVLKLATTNPQSTATRPTTLMLLATTQDQRGLPVGTHYPVDTMHAAGIYLLHRGDSLHVRPDSWTLNCRLMTEPYKTHLDAFLIKGVTN